MISPSQNPLRLATRGSLLAHTQSQWVADAITEATGRPVELITLKTEGDNLAIPLDAPSRPGAFAARLRDALISGEADLAVHSFKDLPSAPLPGLVIAAVPKREDPRDAWCSRDGIGLSQLPAGGRVGTSSPRRAIAVKRVRPDLTIVPIRGNVDTRLRKVAEEEVDAVVLAAAGLLRVGHGDAITEFIDPAVLLPAPAQGALAVECRTGELETELRALDDRITRLGVTAERTILAGIEATCTTAVGALATRSGPYELRLDVEVSEHRGITYSRKSATAEVSSNDEAVQLGKLICAELATEMS